MKITACPKCGSRKIFQGRMGDGVLSGYTSRNVCRNCGYQGMPIIFDNEEDYKKFLQGLKKEEKQEEVADKNSSKREEKNVVKERPFGVTILALIMILQAIFVIYIYYDLIGFENVPILWGYYIVILVISAVVLPYGLIKGRPWAWTMGGLLFALSIPIGLIFLYYITRPHVREYFGKN